MLPLTPPLLLSPSPPSPSAHQSRLTLTRCTLVKAERCKLCAANCTTRYDMLFWYLAFDLSQACYALAWTQCGTQRCKNNVPSPTQPYQIRIRHGGVCTVQTLSTSLRLNYTLHCTIDYTTLHCTHWMQYACWGWQLSPFFSHDGDISLVDLGEQDCMGRLHFAYHALNTASFYACSSNSY